MKQFFAIVLILGLMLSLAACGQGEPRESTSDTTPDTQQQEQTNTPGTDPAGTDTETTPSGETLTVADFLKVYGYTEEDITPAHFLSFDPVEMDGGDPGELGSTGFVVINIEPGVTTAEDFNAWFQKIFDKMTELSQDGKLYKDYLFETEATPLAELQAGVLWEIMPGFGPYFYHCELTTGTGAVTMTARYDTEKDRYTMGITVWSLGE